MKLKQVSDPNELEGKTIKKVISSIDVDLALIFTDDTFCVFETEYDSSCISLSDNASLHELMRLGAITQDEADALKADAEESRKRKAKEERRKQYLELLKEFA